MEAEGQETGLPKGDLTLSQSMMLDTEFFPE